MIGRRLSFIVGVSSSPPGSQSPGTRWKRLTCSARASRSLAASTPCWTAARTRFGERDALAVPSVLAVHEHDVLEAAAEALADGPDPRQEGGLGDDDARGGVAHDVLDLLGRGGLVDRERRAARGDDGGVADVELGAVGEQQRHALAAPQPEPREPAGDGVDALAQLAPGERHGVAARADRDLAGALRRGDAERLRDRRGLHRRARRRHASIPLLRDGPPTVRADASAR